MSLDRTIVITGQLSATAAIALIRDNWSAMAESGHPLACRLYVYRDTKSRAQERMYHDMIDDIAKQMEFCGKHWDSESMKRICVDQFRRDTANDPDIGPLWKDMGTVEMAPSLDGTGVVALGWQTRKFPKKLAIAFIDWLYALGAEKNVKWSAPDNYGERYGNV